MMSFLQRVFAFLLCFLCTGTAVARSAPEVNPDRTVIVSGAILQGNILALVQPMYAMAAVSTDPISILLDSPGGEVLSGQLFINEVESLKARGISIRCYVPGMAASMAFQILVHCSERYTLDRSFLLWHPVRASFGGGGALTAEEAAVISRDLAKLDHLTLRELDRTLGMSPQDIRYHFRYETLHVGENLAAIAPQFIETFSSIPGLLEALHNPKVPRMKQPRNFLDLLLGGQVRRPVPLLYIWRGWNGSVGERSE